MKNTIESVLARLKKFAVLFLLIPVFTAALSFVIGNNNVNVNKPGFYTAETTLNLGNFNDPMFDNPDKVRVFLVSTAFLEKVKNENGLDMEMEDLKQNLIFRNIQSEMLVLTLNGEDKEVVEGTLNNIVKTFLQMSDERYKEWTLLINNSIKELKETENIPEVSIEKQELLYKLEKDLFEASATTLADPVAVVNEMDEQAGTTSPVKKAIFGFIVGIMLSLFLLFIPEVFKDK